MKSGEVWLMVVFAGMGVGASCGLRWLDWVGHRESDARGGLMERALSWCGFGEFGGWGWGLLNREDTRIASGNGSKLPRAL